MTDASPTAGEPALFVAPTCILPTLLTQEAAKWAGVSASPVSRWASDCFNNCGCPECLGQNWNEEESEGADSGSYSSTDSYAEEERSYNLILNYFDISSEDFDNQNTKIFQDNIDETSGSHPSWTEWWSWLTTGVSKEVKKHIKSCKYCTAFSKNLSKLEEEKYDREQEQSDEFRKLVTVRTVSALTPIEGADNIETATVDGWQVVVKKGEFEVGDYGFYFEVDSFLPDESWCSFLAKAPKEFRGKLGYRLKTVKLRGQISQGLLLPLSFVPYFRDRYYYSLYASQKKNTEVADYLNKINLTKELGVRKFERGYRTSSGRVLAGRTKGNFPAFIQRTDQERLQNMTQVLDRGQLGSHKFEVSVKMDGSSMTVYIKDGVVGVCSRNLELREEDDSDFWTMAKRSNLPELLQECVKYTNANIALQGEFVGPGINGNYQKLDERDFYLFDIYLINLGRYATPEERMVYYKTYFEPAGVKHVPVLYSNYELNPAGVNRDIRFKELMALADSTPSPTPGVMAEGLVFKDVDGTHHFKLISNNYLLKYDSKD